MPIAPREAAALLGISTRTVARWADTGKLHPVTLPSGHRRYRRAEVEALVKPVEVHR
ncbi:helix-turn-helix domain-containing protein [Leucobacter soli]|uniref:helix-turn-helix domain-containing protein n=1 Tax=Leucobacter soli TaxID=2812850 RepID=UPI003622582D